MCDEAEDAGGLAPAKDDNEAARHFIRRTLPILNCVDYIKHELEQEHQRLLAKGERLKDIDRQLDTAYQQSEKAYCYNLAVERYCQAEGLSIAQYEKQCFWADRGYGEYPEPERNNPDREAKHEKGVEHDTDRGERER